MDSFAARTTFSGLLQQKIGDRFAPQRIDLFVTTITLVLFVAFNTFVMEMPISLPTAGFLAINIAGFLPLLIARRAPVITSTLIWVVVIATLEIGQPVYMTALPVITYYAARFGTFHQSVAVLVSYIAVESFFQISNWVGWSSWLIAMAMPIVTWLMGDRSRLGVERQRLATQQVDSLRAEQSSREREAVTSERLRIARELHDIVSHSLSAIVLHAGGAQQFVAPSDSEVKQALETIETVGRQDLTEIRTFLTSLRSDDEPDTLSGRNIDDLHQLVSRCQTGGLAIELEVEGDMQNLSSRVEMAVYRVVQESLTNTIRHSDAQKSKVRLEIDLRTLDLEITDNGRFQPTTTRGLGILGMRERIESLAGSFLAAPTMDGFRVRASIPLARDEVR